MPPRRKIHLRPVNNDGRPNSVEKLAFKYMEMCKVESSTDSESDISPRSSDTSTMALVTSRQERRPLQKTMSSLSHKAGGRLPCYCRFLDPYDGSSEDSDESHHPAGVLSRRPRQHGGVCSHFLCRSRRFLALQPPAPVEVTKREPRAPATTTTTTNSPGPPVLQHPADIQMDSDGSSSELWVCGLDTPRSSVSDRSGCRDPVGEMCSGHDGPEREEERLEDSGLHSGTRSPTPPPSAGSAPRAAVAEAESSLPTPSGPSERSPGPGSYGCCLYKRKMMGPPGLEMVELGQRKKQCIVSMKEKPWEGDCTAEMC